MESKDIFKPLTFWFNSNKKLPIPLCSYIYQLVEEMNMNPLSAAEDKMIRSILDSYYTDCDCDHENCGLRHPGNDNWTVKLVESLKEIQSIRMDVNLPAIGENSSNGQSTYNL